MADLSNVPPEVMQILAHDPPYSPGELEILRAYAARPDANPVLVRAFQNPSLGVIEPPRRNNYAPTLDFMNGIPRPTLDFLMPSPTDLSSRTLPTSGSGTLRVPVGPEPGITTPALPPDDGRSGTGTLNIPEASVESIDVPAPPPDDNRHGTGTLNIPEWNPFGGGNPVEAILGGGTPTPSRQAHVSGPVTPTTNLGDPRLSTRGAPGGQTTGADWRGLRELEQTLVPPDSAFANIPASDLDKFSTLMANPNLLAGMLYPDTPMTAAMATPNVTALAQLARYGLLSPGTKMLDEGQMGSDINQARLVEQTLNSMKGVNGAEVSPRAIYQEAFRRALNTPVEEMSTGNGDPGDLSNQIAVTNAYLLLAKPFVSQGQQDFFEQKLNRWAEAYAQQYVNGETDVSYPQWLSDHGAQNLLGG